MRILPLRGGPRAIVAQCALAALILSTAAMTRASELRATKDFADAAAVVDQYVQKFGAEHVLLALDIDNTIMSMDNDLGSDHWFEWQSYLLANEPDSPLLVAKTFPKLLEAQGILYNLGRMHPTQPDEPAIIGKLQGQGISTILLTSRGPEFRGATERELKRCEYNFGATALPVHDVPGGEYLAYDPANPDKDGLTKAEIAQYKLASPRPVTYSNGLFMTAGQHKGMMLLTLLKHATRDIKAIVYVDDNVRHIGNVFAAALARNIEATVFHYQHEDVRVQRFQYSDKKDVDSRWRELERPAYKAVVAKTSPQKVEAAKPVTPASPSKPLRRRCRPCCCWPLAA